MLSKRLWGVLLWALALLVGCRPLPAATPLPTPQPVTVQVTTGTLDWRGALHDCAGTIPELGLLVEEVPTTALDPAQVDLALRLGEPASLPGPAYPIGQTVLRVIVHPLNPAGEMSQAELAAIYSGQLNRWDELGVSIPGTAADLPIEAWTYLPAEDLRAAFDSVILDASPAAGLHIAPDPQAMLEAVAASPGALGFLPEAWLVTSVRPLDLDPELQNQLQPPVLALSIDEPNGLPRRLLACLQNNE